MKLAIPRIALEKKNLINLFKGKSFKLKVIKLFKINEQVSAKK